MLGLLLIDHGSRRAESNDQLVDMAERVRRLRPDDLVGYAHMELAPPTIAEAFADLVRRGARDVRALLYFLGDGRHSREDIPRMVGDAAAGHPGVRWSVSPALGPHDRLADLLIERGGLT